MSNVRFLLRDFAGRFVSEMTANGFVKNYASTYEEAVAFTSLGLIRVIKNNLPTPEQLEVVAVRVEETEVTTIKRRVTALV